MNIELASDLLSRRLLRRLDPNANGAFIEVGLGTCNYSFVWGSAMGYSCYAIEPLPSKALRAACERDRVTLTPAAIAECKGEVTMCLGVFNGSHVPDVSSLNPRWWGSGSERCSVPSLAIADFVKDQGIQRIAFLKIDTEGSEPLVLSGLRSLPQEMLPRVIVFEYGGGGTKASRIGGWAPEFFEGTLSCLRTVREAGYSNGLMIERVLSEAKLLDLGVSDDFGPIFTEHAEVGNIICSRDRLTAKDAAELNRAIAPDLRADALRSAWNECRERIGGRWNRAIKGIRRRVFSGR